MFSPHDIIFISFLSQPCAWLPHGSRISSTSRADDWSHLFDQKSDRIQGHPKRRQPSRSFGSDSWRTYNTRVPIRCFCHFGPVAQHQTHLKMHFSNEKIMRVVQWITRKQNGNLLRGFAMWHLKGAYTPLPRNLEKQTLNDKMQQPFLSAVGKSRQHTRWCHLQIAKCEVSPKHHREGSVSCPQWRYSRRSAFLCRQQNPKDQMCELQLRHIHPVHHPASFHLTRGQGWLRSKKVHKEKTNLKKCMIMYDTSPEISTWNLKITY